MDAENTTLQVNNLNLYYNQSQALKSINMQIPSRKVTAFIGPSGCGKSTLLRCFNRMNDLVDDVRIDGEILLDGKNIHDKDVSISELRRRVGMVFQKPNPFPKTIYENVAYGLRLMGVKKRRVLDETIEWALKGAALWNDFTIVIVTHNMQQAARVSDKTAFLYIGELIEFDETNNIFTNPSKKQTEDYITGRYG